MNHLFATYQKNIATSGDTPFSARPLKQWRKAYQNSLGYSRAATGMPMDRPGGLVPVATEQIQCSICNGALPAKVGVFKDSPCTSCQPIMSKVKPLKTAYTNNAMYLQARCATWDQQTSLAKAPNIVYFSQAGIPIEPSDYETGTQIRATANCFNYTTPSLGCKTTIYKPSNSQYAQQGGVSASSRLSRLKYNTLNNNGADYNSASGAMGVNSGRYQTEPSPSYFTKNKPSPVNFPYKNGDKTYCGIANTICM